MKTIALTILLGMTVATPLFADGTNVFKDEKSRISYAIGMMWGHNLKQGGVDVNDEFLLRGIKDAQSGGATLLTPAEMRETLTQLQRSLVAKRQKVRQAEAAKNKQEGEAFLAKNKTKPGVKTFPDGLQYKILKEGSGATPAATDTVEVNYRGTFIDGKEFDSTARTGHPAEFPVTHVIHGWTEALLHMKVGSKWQLFVPSDLAYGEQGRPGIPPNATLIFDVELVAIHHPSTNTVSKTAAHAPITSDIIKVPSLEEMKKGAKIQTIKASDLKKLQQQEQAHSAK